MFNKVFIFIFIVGLSNAVLVDSSVNYDKDVAKTRGWRMVKIYDPPSHAVGYKYEPYTYPKYEFEYSVSDKKSGDHKHHHEARDGDRVHGEYSLVESDGSLRKVQYHADDHNGFNAIVSKLVNKHDDHAVSVTDHTRFFYPVGQNVKINHYFPGKDYHYQNNDELENDKITKPVHEETAIVKKNDDKIVMIDTRDKDLEARPVESEQESKESPSKEITPAPKSEIIEVVPVEIVPTIISMIPKKEEVSQVNPETISSLPNVEISQTLSSNGLPPTNDKQKDETEDQNDSDVASSYYHSKFYYIGY